MRGFSLLYEFPPKKILKPCFLALQIHYMTQVEEKKCKIFMTKKIRSSCTPQHTLKYIKNAFEHNFLLINLSFFVIHSKFSLFSLSEGNNNNKKIAKYNLRNIQLSIDFFFYYFVRNETTTINVLSLHMCIYLCYGTILNSHVHKKFVFYSNIIFYFVSKWALSISLVYVNDFITKLATWSLIFN